MSGGAIIGAVVGLILAWLIAAMRSRATHLGGGGWRFEGLGCLANLLLYLVFAAVGAVIGAVFVGILASL
ncbi:MAG: hypothetical protein NUW24_06560 [Anaerolineae bacterium]|jgi:uncharacterized protein involved in cysteine biosynthesis|nr:hypothetical protein [Anaerolineae bacterium]MDH7472777.1 hypothetical protein [Anaerolineae bacterium]